MVCVFVWTFFFNFWCKPAILEPAISYFRRQSLFSRNWSRRYWEAADSLKRQQRKPQCVLYFEWNLGVPNNEVCSSSLRRMLSKYTTHFFRLKPRSRTCEAKTEARSPHSVASIVLQDSTFSLCKTLKRILFHFLRSKKWFFITVAQIKNVFFIQELFQPIFAACFTKNWLRCPH